MAEHGQVQAEVFSIVDPDGDIWKRQPIQRGRRLEWTEYHIENYLLDEVYIKEALGVANLEGFSRISETRIVQLLEEAAEGLIDDLSVRMVRDELWRKLRRATDITLHGREQASIELADGIAKAAREVQSLGALHGNQETTGRLIERAREKFHVIWRDGLWKAQFPGRRVLKRLCDMLGGNVEYLVLRNAIVGAMARVGYQPEGMARVIKTVREA